MLRRSSMGKKYKLLVLLSPTDGASKRLISLVMMVGNQARDRKSSSQQDGGILIT